jgi:DNA-binding winged helix-turn-helix (wHTH) protein/TolB-like protein
MSRKAPEIDPKPAETITFGGFVFLTKSRELRTAEGKAVDLRSQSAEVLSALAARPGEIVSKDALMQAVWPDTFVTDDSLTQCIADIRRALGDDEHVIVETFPKRGYRLNADSSDAADSKAAAGTERAKRRFPRHGLVLAAIVLVAAVIGVYYGVEIWRAAPVRSSDMARIAVLPFDDISAGADKGYLSDAVAEGIITELARSKTYAVIARNSSFRYRGQPIDVRQIGHELGVDYLLQGSQQKIGDRLKVTVQLLDAGTDRISGPTPTTGRLAIFRPSRRNHPHACRSGRAQDQRPCREGCRAGQRAPLLPDGGSRDRQGISLPQG